MSWVGGWVGGWELLEIFFEVLRNIVTAALDTYVIVTVVNHVLFYNTCSLLTPLYFWSLSTSFTSVLFLGFTHIYVYYRIIVICVVLCFILCPCNPCVLQCVI